MELQLVVLESHRGAFSLDARPDRAFFLIGQKYPVRHFRRRAATAFADFVEERRADANAGAVGEVVQIR